MVTQTTAHAPGESAKFSGGFLSERGRLGEGETGRRGEMEIEEVEL